MPGLLLEEHKRFGIDCRNAIWATDEMYKAYHDCHLSNVLSDSDFVIETSESLLLVEYKNSMIDEARNHVSVGTDYSPFEDKNFNKIVKKFYDSLHYLRLLGKEKPLHYIFVIEYSKGDVVSRKLLRNRLKKCLPFELQKFLGTGVRLIESVEVVNIAEWNNNSVFGNFPIKSV